MFEAAVGNYTPRLIAALHVAVVFPLELFIRHLFLLAKEGLLFDVQCWRRGLLFLFGLEEFLTKIAGGYGVYVRRNLHPADTESFYIAEFDE